MAFRIPRLPRGVAIVGKDGWPMQKFQQWWQTVAVGIEAAIKGLDDTLDALTEILVQLGLIEVKADGALALADSAINPDGTIKTNKVVTESVVDNAISGASDAQGSVTMSGTAAATICTLTLTPLSTATKWLVIVSGLAQVGDLAPSGTTITIQCDRVIPTSGLKVGSKLVGASFNMAAPITGLTGPVTLTLTAQASGGIGAGDPHLIDIGRIIALKLWK